MESVSIEKYVVDAEPEHTHLQAPILDLTQHVSTSQKAHLLENEPEPLRTLKCVALPFFHNIFINSKNYFNSSHVCWQKMGMIK